MENPGIKLSFHMALLYRVSFVYGAVHKLGGGRVFKSWSKLLTDSTKKLPTCQKFQKNCWCCLWMVPMQTLLLRFSLLRYFRTFQKFLTEVIRMYLCWSNFFVYMHSIFFNWVVDLQQLFFDAFTTYCLYKCSWYIR